MLITEFYANRDIFITGGTGFLGKALIEKLLRSCPNVKTLYILLRARKSQTAEERLEDLKQNTVFDRIRRECPHVLSKLHAIQGDSIELGLGITPSDLELLKNVSIIFHMAANVKFDDPFRSSILLNTRGTYELVKIAEKLKNLVVFLHCSTAFCNPLQETVEEKVYKIPFDWRKTIQIAETYDELTLNILFNKYTGHYPNTYTFTKNLSEQIMDEYAAKLPIIIFRPSIVINAESEPEPGWIDNLNGIIGSLVGGSLGITPLIFSGDINLDCVPIDVVTKLTAVAAFKRGMQKLRKETIADGLEVVNCVSDGIFDMSIGCALKIFKQTFDKNPMENCIWRYDLPAMTSCRYNLILHTFLMNLPLSLVIDTSSRLIGKKPIMLKLTRRLIYAMNAISFFSTKNYNMKNSNMFNLEKSIPESEMENFASIQECLNLDFLAYFDNIVRGLRVHIFNQPIEATDAARLRYRILFILNKTIKLIVFVLILILLLLKINY